MPGQARLGDKTYGYCSKCDDYVYGKIITASEDHLTNGKKSARLNDLVECDSKHQGTINVASTKKFINGRGAARLEDTYTGDYSGKIIEASEDHIVG